MSRRDLTRWVRLAVAGASGLVFGLGLMGMLVQAHQPDLNSFGGGYAYVQNREATLGELGTDPLDACQMYLDTDMYLVDGYTSPGDFLEGCRAAARKKH